MRVAYHPGYDLGFRGLGKLHPFDLGKYGRARALARSWMGGPGWDAVEARVDRGASEAELRAAHDPAYLASLGDPAVAAAITEVPLLSKAPRALLERFLWRPVRLAVRGTAIAAEAALRCGMAANLAGGYHHAKPASGEGFCAINDLAVAIAHLRASGLLGGGDRVLVIDTDAHLGNGNLHHFMADPRVAFLDAYNMWAYPLNDPQARARVDWPLPLDAGARDGEYHAALRDSLRAALDSGPWALAVHNAGTDVCVDDWVGGLGLSAQGIFDRDAMVTAEVRRRGIPLLMLPSGGYTADSYRYLARTVAWMATGRDHGTGIGPAPGEGEWPPLPRPGTR